MVTRIQTHVTGANRCRHCFDHVILIWAVLMNYREGAIRIGSKGVPRARVVSGTVDSFSDRKGRHRFSCLVVRHRHNAAAASAKQTMVKLINGHRDRLLAWGGGPSALYCGGLRVNLNYLAR